MFNLNSVLKTFKKYAIDKNVADEVFLNNYLSIIVYPANIENKNGEEFYLDKSRVSELMKSKADVPKKIRTAVMNCDYDVDISDELESFMKENIDERFIDSLKTDLIALAKNDPTVPDEIKNGITNENEAFWLNVYRESLRADNMITNTANIIWEKGLNSVKVIANDLFNYSLSTRNSKKTITVIPVNTSFDTHITRNYENELFPIVSENTLHGHWLERIIKSGINEDEIYKRIVSNLTARQIKPAHKSASDNSKPDCYPIGTVAVYKHKNCLFYLVAISEFDKKNNAYGTAETIKESLKSVLNEYNETGQGYDLYMPLLGTGRSRAGLSNQESFDLIKTCLKENISLIQGNITIVILPDEIEKITIGW